MVKNIIDIYNKEGVKSIADQFQVMSDLLEGFALALNAMVVEKFPDIKKLDKESDEFKELALTIDDYVKSEEGKNDINELQLRLLSGLAIESIITMLNISNPSDSDDVLRSFNQTLLTRLGV